MIPSIQAIHLFTSETCGKVVTEEMIAKHIKKDSAVRNKIWLKKIGTFTKTLIEASFLAIPAAALCFPKLPVSYLGLGFIASISAANPLLCSILGGIILAAVIGYLSYIGYNLYQDGKVEELKEYRRAKGKASKELTHGMTMFRYFYRGSSGFPQSKDFFSEGCIKLENDETFKATGYPEQDSEKEFEVNISFPSSSYSKFYHIQDVDAELL